MFPSIFICSVNVSTVSARASVDCTRGKRVQFWRVSSRVIYRVELEISCSGDLVAQWSPKKSDSRFSTFEWPPSMPTILSNHLSVRQLNAMLNRRSWINVTRRNNKNCASQQVCRVSSFVPTRNLQLCSGHHGLSATYIHPRHANTQHSKAARARKTLYSVPRVPTNKPWSF